MTDSSGGRGGPRPALKEAVSSESRLGRLADGPQETGQVRDVTESRVKSMVAAPGRQ
jgi:hypothetical protein